MRLPICPILELHSWVHGGVKVVAIKDLTLGKLRADLTELCKQSGWWAESDAFTHLLFGGQGGRGVRVSAEGDFDLGGKITITVEAPATVEEVTKSYKMALKAVQCAPVALTFQQEALLNFVQQMPNATWDERAKAWQKFCSKSKNNYKPYQNGRSLFSAYRNAVSRAKLGWNKQPGLPEEKSTA